MTATEAKRRAWTRRRDNPDTRSELLHAAAVAFARFGYEGASLTQIAESIGITAPSVYNHFKSKNELLFTFLDEYAALVSGRCDVAVKAAADTPEQKLRAFVVAYVSTDLENLQTVPLVNLYFQHGAGAERALTAEQIRHLTTRHRRLVDLLRAIVADGVEGGVFAPENDVTATFSVLGSISNAVYWFRPKGPLKPALVAEQLAEYAVRSLRPA